MLIGVDSAFESLLSAMFGCDVISEFKHKRAAGYIDLMIAFESRKRSANPNKLTSLNVALPFSFIDFYRKARGKDVCFKVSFRICNFSFYPRLVKQSTGLVVET